MNWLQVVLYSSILLVNCFGLEDGMPEKKDGIQDKSSNVHSMEDLIDPLIQAESQDVASEHKLYQVHQGQLSGNMPLTHLGGGRQQHMQQNHHQHHNLPPHHKQGHQGQQGMPFGGGFPGGPAPVYHPGHGGERLMASGSHNIENAVEYGPEITGPQVIPSHSGQPPHSPPQGQQPPAAQFNQPGQGQVQPAASSSGGNELWPLAAPDTPKIIHLDVKCEKNLMKVAVEFDKAFNGIIFSKGHFSHGSCVHLPPNTGKNSIYFDISINSCGTTGNTQNGLYGNGAQTGSGTFFENTIVIQYDPQVQEVWDQARKLRCTWHDQYEKSVTFRPFPVDMLDVVRADFAGDNVGCWMQIQVGKGPWASEVAGIVKIGQTMTIVLAIKDEENKFDMLVRNCIAHDGKRAPIELVDSSGCIVRPKIMSKFTKIKNFGSSASVLSYAHFQAFKFPDSMEVHFQCTIQICRYQCPDQCSQSQQPGQPDQPGDYGTSSSQIFHTILKPERAEKKRRRRRGIEFEEIGVNKIIQVVSSGDLAFENSASNSTISGATIDSESLIDETFKSFDSGDLICMSTLGFTASAMILTSLLIASCLVATFFFLKATQFKRKGQQHLFAARAHCSSTSARS